MRLLPIAAVCVALGACGNAPEAPKVVVDTSGHASTAANPVPTSGNPLDILHVMLGNDLSKDDAATINVATAGKDPLGLTFANDIAVLINAGNDQAAAACPPPASPGCQPDLGTLHILYTHEELRLKLIAAGASGTQAGPIQKAFNDGMALIQDDVKRGIAVSQQLRDLVGQLGVMAAGANAQGLASAVGL